MQSIGSASGSALRAQIARFEEHVEAFLREGEEDVVLAGEVAVDRGGAVLDLLRDLADRDVLVALGDEELPGSVQYGAGRCLTLPFLTFLDPHVPLQTGLAKQCSLF